MDTYESFADFIRAVSQPEVDLGHMRLYAEAMQRREEAQASRCKDFDEDCEGIACKLTCWLHDPTQGVCPYLLPRQK